MFQDYAEIEVHAGKGGDGCISFRREKFVPKGGPNGGNGGHGGDIVIYVDPQLSTFSDCNLRTHYRAEKGRPGEGSDKTGRCGEDLLIAVPPGTIVRDAELGHVLKDLTDPDDRVVIVKGGAGGRGNASFKSATRQVPRRATRGKPGASRKVIFDLSLMADVGLIGLPNAGKSTLLSRITQARPRIADYPFTTLTPHLGVVRLGYSLSFVVADIPGLIAGAADGAGLGHEFLRHIERTRVLVHLVDAFPPEGDPDPVTAFRIIREEIERFSPSMGEKPEVLVLTKSDLGSTDSVLKSLSEEAEREVSPVSAVTGQGLSDLLARIVRELFPDED